MKKLALIIFLFNVVLVVSAQTKPIKNDSTSIKGKLSDDLRKIDKSSKKSSKNNSKKELSAKNYLVISHKSDTTHIDTSLTVNKNYKINYLRRDYFDLLPFANTGQTFNSLSFSVKHQNTMPLFAARGKHFNYFDVDDVYYYDVPTPFTELYYKSVFTQGQIMESFLTINTSKQLNLSIRYKALRSLGKYLRRLSSSGNFCLTGSYKTKNKRYALNAHFIGQDLLTHENGGIRDEEIVYFETGEQEYLDRGVFTPNFEDGSNMLNGKRYYLQHRYNFIGAESSKNKLSLGHVVFLEDKYYRYEQASAYNMYGESFLTSQIRDVVKLENFYNKLELKYTNKTLGSIGVNAYNNSYNYGYNRLTILKGETIINRLKGNIATVGATYNNKIGRFKLYGDLASNISGDFKANYINAKASINVYKDIHLGAELNSSSRPPNYNAMLYQSAYTNYNWQNNYKNINTQQLSFNIKSKKVINASIDAFTINNYTYFGKTADTLSNIKPFQSDKTITYLRAKVNKEIRFRNIALENTIMYQKVADDDKVLNLPEIITRNTLYYSNHIFKKALYLQTGVTLSYFTKFYANAYNPVMSEFYVQNEQQIGDYPRLDFFIDGKIRTARFYFKLEHFNSRFTGFNYYSAPNYPYRDFAIRFGIVWNFFL